MIFRAQRSNAGRPSVRNSYAPLFDSANSGVDETAQSPPAQGSIQEWLNVDSDGFQLLSGAVIMANSIVIGMETDMGPDSFLGLEQFFCFFFWMEMILRIHRHGCKRWSQDGWNLFDCAIVTAGTLELYILPSLISGGKTGSSQVVSMLRIFRMARILRLIRLFRLSLFRDLIFMMSALRKAFGVVMWVGVLTLLIDYICAIFITHSVGHHAYLWGEHEEDILYWFGSVPSTIRTLFIIMTLADWDKIADVLSKQLPTWVVFGFSVFYILIVSYAMVSLITGVISESLITAQNEDHSMRLREIEKGREALFDNLRTLLASLDVDGSGSLERHEIEHALKAHSNLFTQLSALDIDTDMNRLLEIYDRLGEDDIVTIDIFVEALSQLAGMATSSGVFDVKHIQTVSRHEAQTAHNEQMHILTELYNEFSDFRSNVQQDLLEIHAVLDSRTQGSCFGGRTPRG